MFRTSIVQLQDRSYAVCCNLVCLDTSCCYEGERRTALQSSALTVSPLSHLPSPVPTKSNLNLADSLPTAISDPDLCRYIKFLVPNFMSNLLCWEVIQKDLSTSCCNILQHAEFFYDAEILSPRSTTNLEDHPSSALRYCSYILVIIRHIRRTAFTLSLFIDTITNIMKIIKQLYPCSVMSVHSVLSIHVQCYCQCHNTDSRHWP